jgi:hypothetical protein
MAESTANRSNSRKRRTRDAGTAERSRRSRRQRRRDETPAVFERHVATTATRVVSVGERVEPDLDDIKFAQVRRSLPSPPREVFVQCSMLVSQLGPPMREMLVEEGLEPKFHLKMKIGGWRRNCRVPPTSAIGRSPPIHRANREGQERVDSGPLASKPMVLTEENIKRTVRHGQPGLPRPLPLRRRQDRLPGRLAEGLLPSRSIGCEIRTGDQPSRPDGAVLL